MKIDGKNIFDVVKKGYPEGEPKKNHKVDPLCAF